jgi:hypothetical protein
MRSLREEMQICTSSVVPIRVCASGRTTSRPETMFLLDVAGSFGEDDRRQADLLPWLSARCAPVLTGGCFHLVPTLPGPFSIPRRAAERNGEVFRHAMAHFFSIRAHGTAHPRAGVVKARLTEAAHAPGSSPGSRRGSIPEMLSGPLPSTIPGSGDLHGSALADLSRACRSPRHRS